MAKTVVHSNAEIVAKEIRKINKRLEEAIFEGIDKEVGKGLENLRKKVRTTINDRRRGFNADQKKKLPEELKTVPKSKADITRMVFGEDLELTKFKNARDGITYQRSDSSNIIPISKDNHVGISSNLYDSTSYEEFISEMIDRLSKGIYVDNQGRMFILPEDAEQELRDSVKIECSTKHIDHPISKKAFYRWKLSLRKNARKAGNQKYINTRIFQDGVKRLMAKATPLDPVIDMIEEGKFGEAQGFLAKQGAKFEPIVDRIQEIKKGTNLAEDDEALVNTINLIRNMKIKKRKSKNLVIYSVISTFNEDGEGFQNFMSLINRELVMWLVDAREGSYESLSKAIEEALKI